MPFLPQNLLVWPIVLRVHSPLSWNMVTGNEMKLLQSNGNMEVTITPFEPSQVYGA